MKTYSKDLNTGKVYTEEALAPVIAVDPASFENNIQNLQTQITDLQSQISTVKTDATDFFTQFPELLPDGQTLDTFQ